MSILRSPPYLATVSVTKKSGPSRKLRLLIMFTTSKHLYYGKLSVWDRVSIVPDMELK